MMKKFAIALLCIASAGSAVATVQMLDEERLARSEESRIIAAPIAGITNHFWYDYRTNVGEAQKELSSDLRHATDTEDRRDAWEEYRHELVHERGHYVKEMAERGHRYGLAIVGE
ncbi:hypothetical protein LWE61_00935 [Sphingobium sufflavum]|uniref:hypothetical protein n=1 Tax=Sphingobium sufflavum TaxID=1129547 RepID=UPI001F2D633E|nr:hypothetical protein [Sphingobium sufflavum]MCE7795114.1 hypothetical protein [Sphingobium sufflavum]